MLDIILLRERNMNPSFEAIMTIVFHNLIKCSKVEIEKAQITTKYVQKSHSLLKCLESEVLYTGGSQKQKRKKKLYPRRNWSEDTTADA